MAKTMAVLVPLENSNQVKQLLISNNDYDNNFRPTVYSGLLGLPVKGDFNDSEEIISNLKTHLDIEISIEKCLLEQNYPKLSPAKNMKRNISRWLNDNEFIKHEESLLIHVPQKWELLGDLALLPSSAFNELEWQTILNQCEPSQIDDLWELVCKSLKVNRLGRQQPISNNQMRTSQVELLYGSEGWVEFVDNGVYFGFDATKVMFSSGNVSERHRIGEINMENEIIVDAFAGIGYYTLPMLVRSNAKHIHACEINPDSIEALNWGIEKNEVTKRITIHKGDNKTTLPALQECADRCHLGILPSSKEVWELALKCLKPEGGWLHIHMNVLEDDIDKWIKETIETLEHKSRIIGRDWNINPIHLEKVKWYAPYIRHVVLDVKCC